MNLYAQLGIDNSAGRDEVKRAYFRLARKHTPENDPETFKLIRRAYEKLSNDAERAEYDRRLTRFPNVPDDAVAEILEAERLQSGGMTADAIRILERRKYADKDARDAVQYSLCEIYLEEEKSGHAAKIAGKLLKDNPGEERYLRLALKAYKMRGWTTKADAVKRELSRFRPQNEDDALLMLEDEAVQRPSDLGAIVENIESHGNKAPLICVNILTSCIGPFGEDDGGGDENVDIIDDVIEDIIESGEINRQITLNDIINQNKQTHDSRANIKARPGGEIPDGRARRWNDLTHAAEKLAEHTADIANEKRSAIIFALKNVVIYGMYYFDRYEILPYINQVITNVGADDIFESADYKCVSACYTAIIAVRAGIPKKLAALPVMRAYAAFDNSGEEEHKSDWRHEAFLLETDILDALPRLKRFLPRLKSEYKDLYAFAGGFYDEIQLYNEHKIYTEMDSRLKKINNYENRFSLEWLGVDEDEEDGYAYARQEPVRVVKVGRNDPCPCGSGKKYKKCCGA